MLWVFGHDLYLAYGKGGRSTGRRPSAGMPVDYSKPWEGFPSSASLFLCVKKTGDVAWRRM